MSGVASSTPVFFHSSGAIFYWVFVSKTKGAHPFLVYYDPLIFGGEINEIGAVLRKMVTHFVDSSVDRAGVYSLLFVVDGVRGRVVGR